MANKAAHRLILFRSKATSAARWLSTSAKTAATSTESSTVVEKVKEEEEPLYRKLSVFGANVKPADTLDEWARQGKPIKRFDIISSVNFFRRNRKFHQAVEIYEWMEKTKSEMNNADRAIFIDLISKTEGVGSAEKYFNDLEGSAKTKKTYGALLSCYCKEKMFDKAIELFETMKELNFVSSLNYSNMMTLYLSIDQPEKVLSLSEEMEEKNIAPDIYTYNKLMNSYAALGDMDAVERVFKKLETSKLKRDWFAYGNLATIYVNAGLIDKANAVLQKIENMENLRDREAFHTLINLYARTDNASAVDRAWEALKSKFPETINVSYLIKLLALSKLGDFDGLEKSFREWESGRSMYDVRVSNVILETYLDRNMIEEANTIYESMVKRGSEPNLRTLDLFTNYYLENHKMDLALKFLEMGASKKNRGRIKWFPSDKTVSKFVKYFEEKKDVDGAEQFCASIKKIGRLDSKVYDSLMRTDKEESQILQRLKEGSIKISCIETSPGTEELLNKLRPE